jgi:hypothetical protein
MRNPLFNVQAAKQSRSLDTAFQMRRDGIVVSSRHSLCDALVIAIPNISGTRSHPNARSSWICPRVPGHGHTLRLIRPSHA